MSKVDKKAPIYVWDEVIKSDGQPDRTFRVELKRPTRSQLNDADMYYAIQLSKYIKAGLLTVEQVAKRQIDVGGTLSEEQVKNYVRLQSLVAEKEEMFFKLMEQKELSIDEEDRKRKLYEDLALLRAQILEYEYLRNQIYEHTANSKARNDVIMWWVLNLAQMGEIQEGKEEVVMKPFVEGENYETKQLKLYELEDNEDKMALAVFPKLAKVATLWYWMGISDNDKLKKLMIEEGSEPKPEEKTPEKPEDKPSEAVESST